jgi:hypothetical protein
MKTITFVLVAMLVGVGCDKKDAAPAAGTNPEKAAEAPKEMPKPAATPAAVVAADPDEDIPTTADFEDEADKDIDKATVDVEVDKLAKEIGE